MKYFQSSNRLTDSRKLDAARKRLIRLNRRMKFEQSIRASIQANDKISLDYALRFSNEIN